MHKKHHIDIFDERRFLADAGPKLIRGAGLIGLVGLGLAALLGFVEDGREMSHFLYSYLVSFVFFLTIPLGALFFLCTQHLVRAGWSVAVRRIAELLANLMPILFVLSLPIIVPLLFGSYVLYPWNNAELVAKTPLLAHKEAYLNAPFFFLRVCIYFTIWTFLARFYLTKSLRQDADGDPALTTQMQALSAPACILFALTTTFASFDFLMSLLPQWYSTVFGVYVFAGSAIAIFASLILTGMLLQRGGRVSQAITIEHYHDLGKFMFGFVVFWAYIAFSQFMLIWYANLPEETIFYNLRWQVGSGWQGVSLLLVFANFIIPFFGLVSRHVKRNRVTLAFWAAWLLVMHWVDLFWLVMPNLSDTSVRFGLIDIACFVGLGGLFVAGFAWVATDRSLVPTRDPRLADSLAFKNA